MAILRPKAITPSNPLQKSTLFILDRFCVQLESRLDPHAAPSLLFYHCCLARIAVNKQEACSLGNFFSVLFIQLYLRDLTCSLSEGPYPLTAMETGTSPDEFPHWPTYDILAGQHSPVLSLLILHVLHMPQPHLGAYTVLFLLTFYRDKRAQWSLSIVITKEKKNASLKI